MRLQSESAFVELVCKLSPGLLAGWFRIVNHCLSIYFDGDMVASDNDVLSPPLLVLGGGCPHIDDVVKAGRFFPIGMGVIDLGFKSVFWPAALLISGMKIDAAIGAGLGHDVRFKLKVFERPWIAGIKQVAALSVRHKRTVLNLPGFFVLSGCFPPIEGLAVENGDEAFLRISPETWQTERQRQKSRKNDTFHIEANSAMPGLGWQC